MSVQVIDQSLLASLISEAINSPRLRKNYNFHKELSDKCQRMLVALEPGTVMPIHRHKVDEVQIILRGGMTVFIYDDKGDIIEKHTLRPQDGQYGIQVSANTWHSLEILELDTVIFEVKEGPYVSNDKNSILVTTVPLKWTNRSLKSLKLSHLQVVLRVHGFEFVPLQPN